MTIPNSTQPITGLLYGVIGPLESMFRSEVDLARAEVSQGIKSAAFGVGLLAVAMVISFVALNVITGAIVAVLVAAGWSTTASALIVGIAYFALAGVLVMVGLAKFANLDIAPKRTVKNLRRDATTLAEATQ